MIVFLMYDAVKDLRVHSLKATLLSWAAKWGMQERLRRLLGYHAKKKDQDHAGVQPGFLGEGVVGAGADGG